MSIPGSAEPLLLAQQDTGYNIERSLRFNSSDSAFLSRTFSSPTNNIKWTWCGWVKRSKLSTDYRTLFNGNSVSTNYASIEFSDTDNIRVYNRPSSAGGVTAIRTTSAVFRDTSAWYHIMAVWDSANATAADRLILYVNGTRVTAFSSSTDPTSSEASVINSAIDHGIGRQANYNGYYFDGYLADVFFIDGQALTPSSFTEVSATTGQLIPKAYTGSFGTNGFWLKFSDNSAATATTLGKDYSGNSNNWTPNNLSVEATSQLTPYLSGGTIYNDPFNPNWTWAANQQGYTQGSVNSVQVDFPVGKRPVVNSSVVVVYGSYNNAATTVQCTITYTDATTSVGTNVSATNKWLEAETFTVASTKTISQIKIEWISGDASKWPNLGPITVDGVRLVNSGAGNDSLVDTPTSYGTDTGAGGEVRGNYATINPLQIDALTATLANGNLDYSTATASGDYPDRFATIGVSSGKWYAEATINTIGSSSAIFLGAAIDPPYSLNYLGATSTSWGYYSLNGQKFNNNSSSSYGSSFAAGDVIGIALDLTAGTMVFYKNGVSQGTAYSSLPTGTYFIGISGTGTTSASMNFGQRQWAYAAPAGFKALCDTNLPAPVVAKSSTVMGVITRNGLGSSGGTVSGLDFAPDLIWEKRRSSSSNHYLFDAVRGLSTGPYLSSDSTAAESSTSSWITGSTSTGYTVNGNDWATTASIVAWCFDAGSNTVSNTQGSITSTVSVRANASAGFSVVTYTGTGVNCTVGHGLNVAPSLIIVKSRSVANDWAVYHAANTSDPKTDYLLLNSTAATADDNTYWNDTAPTSTVFSIGTNADVNTNGTTYVAYCWAPLVGYSSMGSYVGNGSADGPFQWCGFRPRWILIKASSAVGAWILHDTARSTYNVMGNELRADLSDAEYQVDRFDLLSNGFKVRSSNSTLNASSATYIYCAFAENPFQYARAR